MSSKIKGLRLGLTGGIGCGKSAVAGLFAERGWKVLESDAIVRELWEQDAAVKAAAVARWGGAILRQDRGVDRRQVAERVFANAADLQWVEELLHPRVGAHWRAALRGAPELDWLVEIPLLFEKGLASAFDFTLCVWTSPASQVVRLTARGWSPAQITARQARQWPLRDKVDRANLVALNDGSREFLRHQVEWLAFWLKNIPKKPV